MLVKTVREHANRFGQTRAKALGDTYDHPEPRILIETGYVVDAASEVAADAAAEVAPKKAPKGKATGEN